MNRLSVCIIDGISQYSEQIKSGTIDLVLSIKYIDELNRIMNRSGDVTLEDIACKLKSLKIYPNSGQFNTMGHIYLDKFPSLTFLEFKRVDALSIKWHNNIIHSLQELKCVFSKQTSGHILNLILTLDVPNPTDKRPWSNLTKLILSYSKLEHLDPEILRRLPFLIQIDLSHNLLTDLNIIKNPKVQILNLSYNMMESAPTVSTNEICHLKILLLNNNLINDLGMSNLKYLEHLNTLNLSNNLLKQHSCLSEISDLFNLKELKIDGNPLSFISDHRIASVKYLHENACVNHFLLDNKPLSKKEKLQVGSFVCPPGFTSCSHVMDEPFEIIERCDTPSVGSTSSALRKSKKLRDALIEENNEITPNKKQIEIEKRKSHLEAKAQIEILRNRFGEDHWLHEQAGTVVQNIMGFQNPSRPKANQETSSQFDKSMSSNKVSFQSSKMVENSEKNTTNLFDKKTSIEVKIQENREEDSQDRLDSKTNVILKSEIEPSIISPADEEEGDSHLFSAIVENTGRYVFLAYNGTTFSEKDSVDINKVIVWPSKNITSCSYLYTSGKFTTILITFNSIRLSLQEKKYLMDMKEAKVFCSLIREELEKKTLSAMNQTTYRCVKCSAMFSIEKNMNNNKHQHVQCQNCTSSVVIEIVEPFSPNPVSVTKPIPSEYKESKGFVKSPSQSSIGSANSLKTKDNFMSRKYDSDVEIISNPSVSSVEVLEVLTRKKSNEEKKTTSFLRSSNMRRQKLFSDLIEAGSNSSLDGSEALTDPYDINEKGERKNSQELEKVRDVGFILIENHDAKFSSEDYSIIDPEIKIHLLRNTFNDLEEFLCLLRCDFTSANYLKESLKKSKFLVFSNKTIYIFEIIGTFDLNNIDSWIKFTEKYEFSQVETLATLPEKIGFLLVCNVNGKRDDYFILTWDEKITNNFAKLIKNMPLFRSLNESFRDITDIPRFKYITSHINFGKPSHEDYMLFVIPWIMKHEIAESGSVLLYEERLAGIILTDTRLVVSFDCLERFIGYGQFAYSNSTPDVFLEETNLISNIILMEIYQNKIEDQKSYLAILYLEYIKEDEELRKESLRLGFASQDSMLSFISKLESLWSEIFDVELPFKII